MLLHDTIIAADVNNTSSNNKVCVQDSSGCVCRADWGIGEVVHYQYKGTPGTPYTCTCIDAQMYPK